MMCLNKKTRRHLRYIPSNWMSARVPMLTWCFYSNISTRDAFWVELSVWNAIYWIPIQSSTHLIKA